MEAGSDSFRLRWMAWGIAVEGWLARPIRGWGPNNFSYVFDQYFRPEFREFRQADLWYDNAHNVPLNFLVECGLIGLLSYLVLIGSVGYALLRVRRRGEKSEWWVALMAAVFLAHFTQKLAVFESPTSLTLGVAYLALLTTVLNESRHPPRVSRRRTSMKAAALVVLGVTATASSSSEAWVNYSSRQVAGTLSSDLSKTALRRSSGLSKWSPHQCDFAVAVSSMLNRQLRAGAGGETERQLAGTSFHEVGSCAQRSPYDARLVLQLSRLARTLFHASGNPGVLWAARRHLDRLRVWAPRRLELRLEAAEIESALGHQRDAVHILRRLIQDYPNDPEAHLRLALLYRTTGDQERARQVIRYALEQGVSFPGRARRLIRTLLLSETPNR